MSITYTSWNQWVRLDTLSPRNFVCGYCGTETGTTHGYYNSNGAHKIYICTHCGLPTLLHGDQQVPEPDHSIHFSKLPGTVSGIYKEITSSIQNLNYTAAVLLSRKLLMHIAVEQGAPEGLNFSQYVSKLSENGFVPPNADKLLDFIRKVGNQKNHEIVLANATEAKKILIFIESILQFAYELSGEFDLGDDVSHGETL